MIGEETRGNRFEKLLAVYRPRFFDYANRMLRGRFADADDAVAEAMVVMWERFDEYDPVKSFEAWGNGFVHNMCLRAQRKEAIHAARNVSLEEMVNAET